MRSRRSRAIGGFSLMELTVVIVLVGILSAVAIPAFASLASARGIAAAHELARDMNQTRQRAQATGLRTWVAFEVASSSYRLLGELEDLPGRAHAEVLIDPATGHARQHVLEPAAALLSVNFDGGPEVGFDWLGRPVSSSEQLLNSQGVITLSGGRTIAVEPETGLVTGP